MRKRFDLCGGHIDDDHRTVISVLLMVVMVTMVMTEVGWCYNLEVTSPLVYKHDQLGSLFGYSFAVYFGPKKTWLIVGAPRASKRGSKPGEANIRGGQAYRCPLTFEKAYDNPIRGCKRMKIPTNEDEIGEHHQWLGASVTAGLGFNRTSFLMVCAPRYALHYFKLETGYRYEPIGRCFLSSGNLKNMTSFTPCRRADYNFYLHGTCQAGLDTAVANNMFYIGAPGSWFSQGQVFGYPLNDKHKPNDSLKLPKPIATGKGPEELGDQYVGSAMTTGDFAEVEGEELVVGATVGPYYLGKVVIYDSQLHSLFNISGSQIGSNFGHSLCSTDVNGDGLDDLIIGAPYFKDILAKVNQFDMGSVSVFYQSSERKFDRTEHILGRISRGRFGFSLASLGDINLDGYNDVAIGAPHDGLSDFGTVFIHHGSEHGLLSEHSQAIRPSDFRRSLPAFGYSLYGGYDVDSNGYTDLIVGAIGADSVVVIRSRPVIYVTASAEYEGLANSARTVNLSDSRHLCSATGRKVTCLTANLCFSYTGFKVPPYTELKLEVVLDAEHTSLQRMQLQRSAKKRSSYRKFLQLRRSEQNCSHIDVFIDELTFSDKLTPLVLKINYELSQRPTRSSSHELELTPVIGNGFETSISKSLSILNNCGEDNVCVPDLMLDLRPSHGVYMLGTKERLSLEVTVLNAADDAFESKLYMNVPKGVDYVGTSRFNDSYQVFVICVLRNEKSSDSLMCRLGNPLPSGQMVHFNIHFMPLSNIERSDQAHDLPVYVFEVKVNSTNQEDSHTLTDNVMAAKVPVRIESNLLTFGVSEPEMIEVNLTEHRDNVWIHPSNTTSHVEVQHIYEVANNGPSDILSAEVYLVWPTRTLQQDFLLYVMEQPVIDGPLACDPIPDINPLQLKFGLKQQNAWLHAEASTSRTMKRRSLSGIDEESVEEYLNCGTTVCSVMRCRITEFSARTSAIIRVRSKLWRTTVTKILNDTFKDLKISSRLVVKVTKLPFSWSTENLDVLTKEVSTVILVDGESKSQRPLPVPLWILVLSTCGGVIILLLMVLLLYWIGFFKRTRHPKQQLVLNGGSAKNDKANGYRVMSTGQEEEASLCTPA